jgi:hypothetical protein
MSQKRDRPKSIGILPSAMSLSKQWIRIKAMDQTIVQDKSTRQSAFPVAE